MRLTRPCLSRGTTRDIGHPHSQGDALNLQPRALHVPELAECHPPGVGGAEAEGDAAEPADGAFCRSRSHLV